VCAAFACPIKTCNGASSDITKEVFLTKPDYKAIAKGYQNNTPLYTNGNPILGYAWNYDTANGAVRAAMAYCRQQINKDLKDITIKITVLGDIPIENSANLDYLINGYEQKVIKALNIQLEKTGKRNLITQLSTIYQKIGEYQLSEDLLVDLALSGEHLAMNALAYHWAELKKNLTKALSLVDTAVSKNPNFFSYHDTRALVLFRLERREEALQASAHAVTLKEHPIVLDHYGDILWETGFTKEARKQWGKAALQSIDILFISRVNLKIKNGKSCDIVFE
jgi:tetratricopeptide (TPR) repeat protein